MSDSPPVRLMLALFVLCTLLSVAGCEVSDAGREFYAITGVHTNVDPTTGARPSRQDIIDMEQDPYMFSLYVQALVKMQAASESDIESWYQYGGIHGRPYLPWDNVNQSPGAPVTGYCTHDSVLFPLWHRPYLAGLEQILAGHAQAIAASYGEDDGAPYRNAANNFRLPYWDWVTNATIPDIVSAMTVTIVTPQGPSTIQNPLYSYTMPQPLDPEQFPTQETDAGDWYLGQDLQTYRSPDNQVGGPSDTDAANDALNNANLQQLAYYALVGAESFDKFSTEALWGYSLEAVHGTVHDCVGGSWGHMSQLSYSAFDPIFFLHHTNVDRLLAIYQAMNPSDYLTSSVDNFGTYTIVPGSTDTLETPLDPFSKNSQGEFWTSSSARYMSTFGYTYPEIQDWDQSPSELAQNVTAQVNTMWGGDSSSSKRGLANLAEGDKIEWSVHLSVQKFQFDGSNFVVRLFFGDIPADSSTWAYSKTCVGSFAVLPSTKLPPGVAPNLTVYNKINLTPALASAGKDSQDVENVVEFLSQNLRWAVQMRNGSRAPADLYPSLSVTVEEQSIRYPDTIYELPVYGESKYYPEIVKG